MAADPNWALVVLPTVLTSPVLIGAGVAVKGLARRGADGRLERNRLAGTRTRATLASDDAWRAGHIAGEADSVRAGDALVATGVVSVLLPGLLAAVGAIGPGVFVGIWAVLLFAGLAALSLFAWRSVRAANSAARAVAPPPGFEEPV